MNKYNTTMTKIKNNIAELVGNTPLIRLNVIAKEYNAQANIIAKLEYFNPGGSVKDRIALAMIEDAEKKGLLRPNSVIIEPTSGNTGVGLAWVARIKGYRIILVMPETMSVERRNLLKARGAELVLTSGSLGMKGAIAKAEDLQASIEGGIILQQFDNNSNPQIHYRTTAEEIWADTEGSVDVFVAGVGTGGTISGIGKRLKEYNANIEIVAVEPDASAVISGEAPAPHKIQGIGAGFIPKNLDLSVIDKVVRVTDNEAISMGRKLSFEEGLLVGISSGAAAFATLKLAKDPAYKGKNIVVLLPDTGERYLSTVLYDFDGHPL